MPSSAELAIFHRVNPATASKGVNLLVDLGILYKKRGVGMFVASGARDKLQALRREEFRDHFVRPLITEARALGLSADDLMRLIAHEEEEQQ